MVQGATMELLLACIACLSIIYLAVKARKKRIPGPWNLPVLGYLPWLNPQTPYLTLTALAKKYGPIYGLYLGDIYTVVLSDAELIKKTFGNDAASGRAPLHLTHGIMRGYGLICAQGDLWKDQRKFIHHTLRHLGATRSLAEKRKQMEELIIDNVNDLIQFLKSSKVTVCDPLQALRHSLGNVVNLVVFGRSWARDDSTWQWLLHLQEEGTKMIGVAGPLNFLPFLMHLPTSKKTMNFLLDGKQKTHLIYAKLIEDQKKTFNVQSDEPKNLIQAFLLEKSKRSPQEQEKYYNDEQFHHLLADIFGAGLDTTLATLRWYLLYMAAHKDVQSKVRHEIFEAVGPLVALTMDDMPKLPYVEASLAETQRIRSVVPVGIPHGAIKPLQIDEYDIPKGTMIVPLQWAVHMDAEHWPDPHQFNPDRFIDKNGRFCKSPNFLPFQTGKRMCVGDEFARMLLCLFGATIVQKFYIDGGNSKIDLEGECGITLTPKPHELTFECVEENNKR